MDVLARVVGSGRVFERVGGAVVALVVAGITVLVAPTADAQCISGSDCNDHDPCTQDLCILFVCSNPPKGCEDGNQCTIDFCSTPTRSSTPTRTRARTATTRGAGSTIVM
jgi:hypothetical protein